MTDTLYEVIFHGKLVEGFSATDAKANVARLFKASPQQVEQMFTGKRVVIRNQLDQETALKYQALLRKNGAICAVEAMSVAPPASAPAAPAQQPSTAAQPAAAPAAKPNPFMTDTAAPRAPASETGRLPVAGKKVDAILSNVHLTVAPPGVRMSEESHEPPPVVAISADLSLAPVGVRLSQDEELPPPIVPDVEHLSVAPLGSRLADPKPDE